MNALALLKIIGPVLACAGLAWLVADRQHLAKVTHRYEQCSAAAGTAAANVAGCDAVVRDRIETARRADACEAAIKVGDAYSIQMACGAEVKRTHADLIAARGSLADANAQLALAGADRDAAVQRAEARAAIISTRKTDNARTIDAAPRRADGLVRCDARCLRSLAGEAGKGP